MIGKDIDLNTSKIMINIAMIDIALTLTRSTLVTSSRSFINGASPMTIPVSSYFFTILSIFAICEFYFVCRRLYLEHTNASS